MADYSLAELTAAPVPFSIDGVEYKMHPMTDAVHAELDRWVQLKVIKASELSDDLETRRIGVEVASVATWRGKYGAALSRTDEGVARYMLASMRQSHPGVQLSTVLAWVKDRDKLTELNRAFALANGINPTLPPAKNPADPATSPSSTPT